jgi:hypothetical protein
MNTLEDTLRQFCSTSPRWMQLQFQAFWYGLISTAITYAEEGKEVQEIQTTPRELCIFVDQEFESWPMDWLDQYLKEFLVLHLTEDELHHFLERLDDLFKDYVPVDLHIFSILTSGSELGQEQWTQLHDALAFTVPIHAKQYKQRQKTRCTHGRRAVTPMRSRRALTRKSRHTTHPPVIVHKLFN